MSNIFRGTKIVYFQIPQAVIVSRLLLVLPPSAMKMYIVLLHRAQQFSRSDLKMTNDEFASFAGLSPNSVRVGRIALCKHGLIQIEKGGGYTYIVCDPATKQPISRDKSKPRPADSSNAPCTDQCRPKSSARSAESFVALLTREEKQRYFESRLPGRRKPTPGGFMAECRFHRDTQPSLKVDVEKAIWFCHGCKFGGGMVALEMKIADCDGKTALDQIANFLGRGDLIRPKSTAEQTYDYVSESGEMLFQVRRYGGKKFKIFSRDSTGRWKMGRGNSRPVLYRLAQVIEAKLVIVVEGEKDADRCKQEFPEPDIAATTNPFGAGAWREEYAPLFQD